MTKLFQTKAYCKYLYKARHRKGYGIHSPFLFHFLVDVIYEKSNYYCFKKHKIEYRKTLQDQTIINLPNLGTGNARKTTVSKIAKSASKSNKDAQLLFRLAQECKANTIIELGTNLGLTTQLLAHCNSNAKIYTFEGAKELCKYANKQFQNQNLHNIQLIEGNINNTLPAIASTIKKADFVFFDANHTYDATIKYFEILFPLHQESSIFVFDDIHQSKGMEKAWEKIIQNKEITISLDFYRFGIILFKKGIPKQHRIISY